MRKNLRDLLDIFKTGDMILLGLCLFTTAFGCVIISSTTAYMGAARFVLVQLVAALLGVGLYFLISSIDLDYLLEHRTILFLFNVGMILLLVPFGVVRGGNKSWIDLPLLPINIQPAEICKMTYILIMASVMSAHQSRLSSLPSVMHMVFHLMALVGLNLVISGDAGVSLIFVFIFIGMAFAGGVRIFWFVLGGGCLAAVAPILWFKVMDEYQRKRFEVLYNPEIDPLAIDERYHTNQALQSLTAGNFSGQGLYEGGRTQVNALAAQHTDYIFAAIGEELGFLGCMIVLLLEFAIIARCVYVGIHSPDFVRRVVCFGCASALVFQVTSNVGMCLGLTPVIGLTLPFVSYGGSSIVSLYAMLGLVSGVHARPASGKHSIYIHPPR